MSFRRKRDEWDEVLKRHGAEMRACGVPDEVTRDRGRLPDHGFDQDGWFESRPRTPWSVDLTTPEQARRLADFIVRHFGKEQCRDLVGELRRRAAE